MLADGTIKPPIGATYPLEEYAQALADIDERRALGKTVVRVRLTRDARVIHVAR